MRHSLLLLLVFGLAFGGALPGMAQGEETSGHGLTAPSASPSAASPVARSNVAPLLPDSHIASNPEPNLSAPAPAPEPDSLTAIPLRPVPAGLIAIARFQNNPIGWRAKGRLAVTNFADPLTLAATSFDAGLSTGLDPRSPYGPGGMGFARHLGVGMTDALSGEFFQTFLLPTIFHQNPCYRFSTSTNVFKRSGYAAAHVFVAHSDEGRLTWNAGELLGTAVIATLANTYHPGRTQGIVPTAERVGISIGSDAAFNILHEFYPDIAKKLHFRRPLLRRIMYAVAP